MLMNGKMRDGCRDLQRASEVREITKHDCSEGWRELGERLVEGLAEGDVGEEGREEAVNGLVEVSPQLQAGDGGREASEGGVEGNAESDVCYFGEEAPVSARAVDDQPLRIENREVFI